MIKNLFYLLFFCIASAQTLQAQNDSAKHPVRLSSFAAERSNLLTILKWKTVCYLSYANFQIQKSFDGTNFSTINTFSASKLRCLQPFVFTDSSAIQPSGVFYRINVGDMDGKFYSSRIVKLGNSRDNYGILSVYPTIVNTSANIVFNSPTDDVIKVKLFNTNGASVKKFSYSVQKGITNISIDIGDISGGNYWITLLNSKGIKWSVPIIKQ
jgi:hypothetical protein